MMTIKEANQQFLEENPSDKIGLTKLKNLRPDIVKVQSDMPNNVCVACTLLI